MSDISDSPERPAQRFVWECAVSWRFLNRFVEENDLRKRQLTTLEVTNQIIKTQTQDKQCR
jgi:hypothetical protein